MHGWCCALLSPSRCIDRHTAGAQALQPYLLAWLPVSLGEGSRARCSNSRTVCMHLGPEAQGPCCLPGVAPHTGLCTLRGAFRSTNGTGQHAWTHREWTEPGCDDRLAHAIWALCHRSTATSTRQPCCLRRSPTPQTAAHIEVGVIQEVDGQAEALWQDIGPQHLGMHKPCDPAAQTGHEGDVTCTPVQAAIRGCGIFTSATAEGRPQAAAAGDWDRLTCSPPCQKRGWSHQKSNTWFSVHSTRAN